MAYGCECGVVASVLKNPKIKLSKVMQSMLLEVQHRGQTSSGFAVYSKDSQKRLKSVSEIGKVSNLFKVWDKEHYTRLIDNYDGDVGIGHVRYATSNVSDDIQKTVDEAQPFLRRHGRPWKKFAIAFNGHLTNYEFLKKGLVVRGETSSRIVDLVLLGGAKEIHFRVSEMPIKSLCCYGADFPSFKGLIAGNYHVIDPENFVSEEIDVDSMGFV